MSGPDELSCDLLVIGSGAGGLSAAVTAAWLGLDVIVIEKEAQFGGTTAWSGGWMWIPRNPLAQAAGIDEDIEVPRRYLRSELGDGYDEDFVAMLLEQGPRMVSFFQNETSLAFIDGNRIPDFHDRSDGSATGGRSLCAAPIDGRMLGSRIKDLRPPLAEVAPFGMSIASGADLQHFLKATRSLSSFLHVARRLGRHAFDMLRHGRGMHLVNGNALVARLLKSADDLGVRLMAGTPAGDLIRAGDKVVGVVATKAGLPLAIRARRGVVLAAGGFPHDTARKAALFPHAPTGQEHWSAAPLANSGDGIRLGEKAGGHVRAGLSDAGAWAPVSLVPKANGDVGRFPHLIERAKPGLIMVRRDGRRFVNEADSYHDVMKGLFSATPPGEAAEAWLICDHAFLRRYGLGRVRPRPFPTGFWLRNGYLRKGRSPDALARACGIDPAGLKATLASYNHDAKRGSDPQFGRGDSPYNRVQGEASHQPNPCVAPIASAPFYAVRIVPGSLGTFAGLRTDASAHVLDAADRPIPGLYAVGNDMSSMMAGRYPAGGITLGPAMTFGFVAAHDAAGVPLANNRS
ncbi:succinate dehydrogenase/fumarate reductase flavoprotein subunit [Bosea sp. BE125]|uniref:FAD-dependent oxidoreductase n=1 Tax=Bosea sp. BE125 TaxID=2817909 RepID=UPI00285B8E49|nr:FAD-dependent oxidoreductase [Bosea sp. BE125]MDR6872735.1 succinate dehydrogenase/fumarate reductase flavoprotein subunit [Bosea sp. BE125]